VILVHTSVHASRLNQAQIHHAIIQRKTVAPARPARVGAGAQRRRRHGSGRQDARRVERNHDQVASPSRGTPPAATSPNRSLASTRRRAARPPRLPPERDVAHSDNR
jgi:hypothetical protein